jgi:hypothetical protein
MSLGAVGCILNLTALNSTIFESARLLTALRVIGIVLATALRNEQANGQQTGSTTS